MDDRLTEALDEALAALARGESRDTCLARYPEFAGELAALIETREQLKVLRPVPALSDSAVAVRRGQFLSTARAYAGHPVSANPLQRFVEWILPSGGQEQPTWIPMLVRAAAVLLIVLGSLGGTAVAAQSSLPDSPLYGVKLAIEDVRLRLAGDPSQQVVLHLAFAANRAREIEEMATSNRAIGTEVQQRLQAELDAALRSAARAGEQDTPRLLEQIRASAQTQEQSLAQALLRAPEKTRAALRWAEQAMTRTRLQAEVALGDPNQFRTRHRQGAPVEPTAAPTRRPHTETPTLRATDTAEPTRIPQATVRPQPTWTPQATVTPEATMTPQDQRAGPEQTPTGAPGPQATVTPMQPGPGPQPTPGQGGPTPQPTRGEGGPGGSDGDGGPGPEGGGEGNGSEPGSGSSGSDGGSGSKGSDSGSGSSGSGGSTGGSGSDPGRGGSDSGGGSRGP